MPDATTLSVGALNQAIAAIDPGAAFQHISYNLTTNNSLAPQWWVFMPYGEWGSSLKAPPTSPFENAILQAIRASGPAQTCFIDIMHLQPSQQIFWADSKADAGQLATALASFINSIPSSATPVVRYIVGDFGNWNPHGDGLLEALFFSKLVTQRCGVQAGGCGVFQLKALEPLQGSRRGRRGLLHRLRQRVPLL